MGWEIYLYDPEKKITYNNIANKVIELVVNESLDNLITTFTINCKDVYEVHLFNHVTIIRDGVTFLTGIILNQEDSDNGYLDMKRTSFECEDWGHFLTKRIIAKTYLNNVPHVIIKDMFSNFSEYTTNNLKDCNITLDRLKLDYVTVREAIEDIFDSIPASWHWYIDKNKDFHMFNNYESIGTSFTTANIKVKTLRVSYSGQESVNRVWIIGRKAVSNETITQYFTGDGYQRYFSLSYEPNETKVYLNDVLMESLLESNDDGAQDFLINKINKVVFIPSYKSPFVGTIKVTYKPTKQFIDYYTDNTNVAKFGLMEKVIKNSDVVDKLAARKYAQAEIKKKSTILRKVEFQSRVTGLQIGQKVDLNVITEHWDVQGQFLIKSLKRNITPGDEVTQFELEELG